ncbi:hypothetical protein CR513_19625, partial [Mucuna pruriens]
MVTNNIQFQENVSAIIQDLQTQIGELATTVNQLQLKVRDRVCPTLSHLSYSRSKLDRFPISQDRIAESKSALASPRPSLYFHIPADRHQVGILQYFVFSAQL